MRRTLSATLTLLLVAVAPGAATQPLTCDLTGDAPSDGLRATESGSAVSIDWDGTGGERVRLSIRLVDRTPTIAELMVTSAAGERAVVISDATFELRIVEGLRRIS
jgi:hypothetical protein